MKYWIWFFVVIGVNILSVECAPGCKNRWEKVFENDQNGTALFGSKRHLVTAAFNGAEIRVSLEKNYFTAVTNVKTVSTELCAQAPFHVGAGFKYFPQNITWHFLEICTTGYVDHQSWYLGRHEKKDEDREQYLIEWFARKTGCDGKLDDPALSVANGVYTGNLYYVVSALRFGADITIADWDHGYATKFDNTIVPTTTSIFVIRGQDLWHLSSNVSGNDFSFEDDLYWNYKLWSTTGTVSTSSWSVGAYVNKGRTTTTQPQEWYLDECWDLVYYHDHNGKAIEGSLDFLRAAVENGQKIKLVRGTNTWSMVPDQVNIHNGHVYGLFLNSIAFSTNPYWYWQEVSTTGGMRVTRYNVGSFQARGGQSVHTTDGKWFVSSRRYRRVFSNDANGAVVGGLIGNLISAIRYGGEVRIGLPEKSLYFEVYNVNIVEEEDIVQAIHMRSVGLKFLPSPSSDFQFEIPPRWNFKIISTTGQMMTANPRIGVFESVNSTSEQVAVDWFVMG